ncbi:unnamed protein product, partial [Amoebophrya sp. A120]
FWHFQCSQQVSRRRTAGEEPDQGKFDAEAADREGAFQRKQRNGESADRRVVSDGRPRQCSVRGEAGGESETASGEVRERGQARFREAGARESGQPNGGWQVEQSAESE